MKDCAKSAKGRRANICSTAFVSMEALERRELLSAFVSTTGTGNWSAIGTWATQDGGAVTHIPGAGDTVTIAGKITVDVTTTVGTGSGDVITLNASTNLGDKTLFVSAPLTVQGNILTKNKSVIDVSAGAGIDFDASAGINPKVHSAGADQINIYFHGTSASHCYFRTKVGTAGLTAYIRNDSGGYAPGNVAGTYTDFSDLNGDNTHFGLNIWPSDGATIKSLDHCTFTRVSMYLNMYQGLVTTQFTISNSIFTQTPIVSGWGGFTPYIYGKSLANLTTVSMDGKPFMQSMNNITSCVFNGAPWLDENITHNFNLWSDNLIDITNSDNGYFNSRTGVYNRTYLTCITPSASNPHISSMATNETYNQVFIDVPLGHDVDDGNMMLSNYVKNNVVKRSFALPHIGGPYPGAGSSLGFVGGTQVYYDHNTIAIGNNPGVRTDVQHGGVTGGLAEFKSNIGFALPGVLTGGSGHLIDQYALEPAYVDPVLPQNCDYNALYNTSYLMRSSSAPGAHDVDGQNPNFIDPTRDLTNYYRTHSGVTPSTVDNDVPAAMAWMIQHPELVPQMIDWVSNGYIPTNIAYKAAADNVAPTNGWIGAMEGKPVGDANLDGVTNFQDYIVLERNFGQANMGWEGGDFNNDGVVNFQDYIILERNFGTSYVSAAPAAAPMAGPADLANSVTPSGGTGLRTSTPAVGPVAPLCALNVTTTVIAASTSFSNSGPLAVPATASTGPALRAVTWPKAQKWRVPPVKGTVDTVAFDLLGAMAL